MCPDHHFSYVVDRKQKYEVGERKGRFVKRSPTGGWRGWCDTDLFSIIINFVFSYKLATSVWLESLSAGKQTWRYAESSVCVEDDWGGDWCSSVQLLLLLQHLLCLTDLSGWPLAEIALQLLSRVSSWVFLHFPGLSWKLNNPLKM